MKGKSKSRVSLDVGPSDWLDKQGTLPISMITWQAVIVFVGLFTLPLLVRSFQEGHLHATRGNGLWESLLLVFNFICGLLVLIPLVGVWNPIKYCLQVCGN